MNKTSNYRKYASKNPLQKFLINKFLETLFNCIEELKVNSVLDAGCGEGFVLSEFSNRNVCDYLEGIEFDKEAINIGKALFPHLSFRQGDIYNMPYENSSFDLVICTEVMEHMEEPDKALEEIVRVAQKYCLFSVPNEPLFMISNLLRGKNILRCGNDIEHVNHWSSRAFEKIIKNKLDIITIQKPFPWTMVLSKKRVDS